MNTCKLSEMIILSGKFALKSLVLYLFASGGTKKGGGPQKRR